MKKRVSYLVTTGFLVLFSLMTYSQIHKKHMGYWRFLAPNAPEGSTSGIVIFRTDTAIMTFDGYDEYQSKWLKVRNDSIIYEIDFGEAKVLFSLKVNGGNSMTGKAVWDNGETRITLTKSGTTGMGVRI